MSPLPYNVIGKLDRASYHLNELDIQARNFERLHREHSPLREFDAEHGFDIWRVKNVEPPPGLGLVAGDFINNLRSALDHLAWELAVIERRKKGLGGSPSRHVAFPIFEHINKKSLGLLNRSVQELPFEAQDIIKSIQPYHRGNSMLDEALTMLHDFWNIDKHREIFVAANADRGFWIGPIGTTIETLDNGDVLFKAPHSPNADTERPPIIARLIAFHGEIEGRLYSLTTGQLRWLNEMIRDEVIPRFTCFFPEKIN